jgi:hypothetical protein
MADDVRLQAAAKTGYNEFVTEWVDQKLPHGDNDGPLINTQYGAYLSHKGSFNKGLTDRTTSDRGSGGNQYGSSTRGTGIVDRLLKTQIRGEAGDAGEFQSVQKGLSTFFDSSGKFRGWKNSIIEVGKILVDEVELHLQQQNDLLESMSKNTGMVGKLSKGFREEIIAASPAAVSLGISFEELRDSVTGLVGESGKFKLLGEGTIKQMELASVFTENMSALGAMGKDFEKIGLGVSDMSREIDKAGHSALEVGLNAKTTTKMIDENLKYINSYGFKNGMAGLNSMVQKSVEFRMEMKKVFDFAEKVWSPEQALGVVANLQMIGGAFGDLNDPIKLMYMATNNVEGLQDALIGAAKSVVTFNREQGRFEVTGANLRRAKEMADQFGMSLQELTTGAVAAMERTTAASDLMSTGLIMDSKDREFLTNLAQMKDGKMVIEVPPDLRKQITGSVDNTAVALESMTAEQAKTLLEQRDAFKKMTSEDYARAQVSLLQNMDRDLSFIRATIRIGIGKELGEAIETAVGYDKDIATNEMKLIRDSIGGKLDEVQTGVDNVVQPFIEGLKQGNIQKGEVNPANPSEEETPSNKVRREHGREPVYAGGILMGYNGPIKVPLRDENVQPPNMTRAEITNEANKKSETTKEEKENKKNVITPIGATQSGENKPKKSEKTTQTTIPPVIIKPAVTIQKGETKLLATKPMNAIQTGTVKPPVTSNLQSGNIKSPYMAESNIKKKGDEKSEGTKSKESNEIRKKIDVFYHIASTSAVVDEFSRMIFRAPGNFIDPREFTSPIQPVT